MTGGGSAAGGGSASAGGNVTGGGRASDGGNSTSRCNATAGGSATAGGTTTIVDAGPSECGVVDTSFTECTDSCSLNPSALVGYPLYSFNHRGCRINYVADAGSHACPIVCARPTEADRGTNAVFVNNAPFRPGPAMGTRATINGQEAGFVTISREQDQADCFSEYGVRLQVYGPSDGGPLLPGVYVVKGFLAEGTAAISLPTFPGSFAASSGSVTITSLSPLSGTFQSDGLVSGSFVATDCECH